MSVCKKISYQNIGVCIGALKHRIEIQSRSLEAPTFNGDVDYDEEFVDVNTVNAYIQTVKGETLFDSTNVERVVTHTFYIRYFTGVTFENWILYKEEYYDILDVENINEENRFYLLRASKRGTNTNEANVA